MGWCLLRLQRVSEARAAFERALTLEPGNRDARRRAPAHQALSSSGAECGDHGLASWAPAHGACGISRPPIRADAGKLGSVARRQAELAQTRVWRGHTPPGGCQAAGHAETLAGVAAGAGGRARGPPWVPSIGTVLPRSRRSPRRPRVQQPPRPHRPRPNDRRRWRAGRRRDWERWGRTPRLRVRRHAGSAVSGVGRDRAQGSGAGTDRLGGGGGQAGRGETRHTAWGSVTAPRIRREPPAWTHTRISIADTRWRSSATATVLEHARRCSRPRRPARRRDDRRAPFGPWGEEPWIRARAEGAYKDGEHSNSSSGLIRSAVEPWRQGRLN